MWVYKRLSCRVIHGQMSFFKKKNINVYVQYVRFYNLLSCRVIHGQMAPQDIRYILRSEPRHGDIFFSFIFTNLHQFTEPHHGDIFLSLIFTIFFCCFTPIFWAAPRWHTFHHFSHSFTHIFSLFFLQFLTHLHQFTEPRHSDIFLSLIFSLIYTNFLSHSMVTYFSHTCSQFVSIMYTNFPFSQSPFSLWEMHNLHYEKCTIFSLRNTQFLHHQAFLRSTPHLTKGPPPFPLCPSLWSSSPRCWSGWSWCWWENCGFRQEKNREKLL